MDYDRKSRYDSQLQKKEKTDIIDIAVDLHTLDLFCKMVVSTSKYIRHANLVNISKFISIVNPERYRNDPEKAKRINFIKKGLEARIGLNIIDPYLIVQHINGGVIVDDGIVDLDNFEDIPAAELEFINMMVSQTLNYASIYTSVDKIMDVCTRFKSGEYSNRGEIVEDIKNTLNGVQNEFRRNRNKDRMDMIFSLRDEIFDESIRETYNRAASPKRKLCTGMQGMNELLGGGFEPGRVYVYFGLPGEGKSATILNLMYQIKKYNCSYQCKDPTKRPCIVMLTMENSVEETIERLFGIATGRPKMTDFDADTAINILKTEGRLNLTPEDPIDIIIQYKPTNSVDTSYLYTLSDDLEDQGYEVIAFFQDYIGRIRSTQHYTDIRLEYGMVVDDFKVFSQFKDIPVITVSQLNRDASQKIDDGKRASRTDLVRILGRSNISESMMLLNNSDGCFTITPEYTAEGKKYLGVQRIKKRYEASSLDCIFLPFSNPNSIKLLEDFGSEPVFKKTLRTQMNTQSNPSTGTGFKMNEVKDFEKSKSLNHTPVFNTSIYSANTIDSIQDFVPLIDPMVFYEKPKMVIPLSSAMIDPIAFKPRNQQLIDPMVFY